MRVVWGVVLGIVILGIATASGCGDGQDAAARPNAPSFDSQVPDFTPRLLEIAGDYLKYSLVHNQTSWAPAACDPEDDPPAVELSRSDAAASHGEKLYLLFARDLDAYLTAKRSASPIGQAIVKEAWQAAELKQPAGGPFAVHASGNQITTETVRDDQRFTMGEQRELFVMFKDDPQTPGTDDGWVYGVVSPDGQTVVRSGRLQNCMECHRDAGVDRLFGSLRPRPENYDPQLR